VGFWFENSIPSGNPGLICRFPESESSENISRRKKNLAPIFHLLPPVFIVLLVD
jgi:hypothetical protein